MWTLSTLCKVFSHEFIIICFEKQKNKNIVLDENTMYVYMCTIESAHFIVISKAKKNVLQCSLV